MKVNQSFYSYFLVQIVRKSSCVDQGDDAELAVVGVVVIVAIGRSSGGRLSSRWFCSGCS